MMMKLIVGLMMVCTNVYADSWQCKNEFETQCAQGQCVVSEKGAFTPMSVSFDDQGKMSVCAYSGCWEGNGEIFTTHDFLMLAGSQLELSTAKDSLESRENILISLDRTDNVALLKAGEFAHPLQCTINTPQFSDYRVQVSNTKIHPIVFSENKKAWMFRTRLRKAQKGKVNFGGNFIFTSWGCGSSCVQAALINTKNGVVFFPEEFSGIGLFNTEGSTDTDSPWEFKKDSRLFILHGQPGNKEVIEAGATHLVWDGMKFKEVKFIAR